MVVVVGDGGGGDGDCRERNDENWTQPRGNVGTWSGQW